MKITNSSIKQLLNHYKEISVLTKIKAVLEWDLNVNLPPKAAEGRAGQVEYLANQLTALWKKKEFVDLLKKANTNLDKLNEDEKAIVRNLNYANKYYSRIPEEIIAEKEKVTAKAFMVWQKARSENKFRDFLPSLKEIVRLNQIIAKHLEYKENPYDALLDLFEPELTAKHTAELFGIIKPALIDLIKRIQKSKDYQSESPLVDGKFIYPQPEQKHLSQFLMSKMGFDTAAGRMDISAHPFTTSLDQFDVRITTRYLEKDFRDSYSSTVHETGHALYEQEASPEYAQTPLEGGVSFGIHEAMSRFWENMVGKNPEFIRFMSPVFQSFFPEQLSGLTENEFVRLFNLVKPSFIRIEADEVTYSLHIILRFELENALMSGELKPEDAGETWREKSKELFGIVPETDSQGVLQDVHWSYGAMGYFPSYALGNLYGAQLLARMKDSVDFDKDLSKGKLGRIHSWLKENIHVHGSKYLPEELLIKATGKPLDPKYFIEYLEKKYSKIYSL